MSKRKSKKVSTKQWFMDKIKSLMGKTKGNKLPQDVPETDDRKASSVRKALGDTSKTPKGSRGKITARVPTRLIEKSLKPEIGAMVMFQYNPKHKKTLPYYDTFPVSIIIGEYKDGFLGINLHYLPPKLRLRLLKTLLDITNNKRMDKTTKMRVTYQILNSATKYKYFKPCVKRYLTSHIRSRVNVISPEEWARAVLLPVANFVGASQSTVWADSKETWSNT